MTLRPKVLLVDDQEPNLIALEATLAGQDCECSKASSGREALELLLTLADDVALVLLDVQMPDMDGFEVAELMRGSERTSSIPIIFVTAALSDHARIFQGYESGAVDFLLKPLDPHVLRSKVGVFLQLFRQKRQLAERVRELELAQEHIRESDRKKGEFLAVLSHELRNPLMPIRTSLYLLDRVSPDSAQAKRALAVIERQAAHLSRLVDDLLDVTRVSRGKIQLRRELVELCALVRRTLDDHRAAIADEELSLELEIVDEPLMVHADPTRLAQIVGNLLANATKFSLRGGRVQVAVCRQGSQAVVSVRDQGVGISPEVRSRLFQPFEQADRTLDRSRGGLGLGLALVKTLSELHGGSVEARSEGVGRGAELVVRLPLCELVGDLPLEVQKRASPPASRRRVLVVEDNLDGAETLKEVLELLGHEVAVVNDGLSVLDRARAFKPEIVLCDIGLPGMDGYDVARQLRREPQLRDVRLVALTGYALPEDQQRAFAAGFSEHMAKPVKLEALERLFADPTQRAQVLDE
jgi:signal transduction histidine kinase